MLAFIAAALWKDLAPPAPAPDARAFVRRELAGGLSIPLAGGGVSTVLENTGYALAGQFVSLDTPRKLRVQVTWNEMATPLVGADLVAVQRAWLGALRASGLAPELSEPSAGELAGHPMVRAAGLGSGQQFIALSWACARSARVVHVLLSAPVGLDLSRDERELAGVRCHGETAPAPAATRAHLPAAAGWRALSASGSRRNYVGPNGLVEVVLEEGPRPAQSPVAHVLAHSELWEPLLTGVLGRPLPVDAPGANRITGLTHGHEAVRVHGRVQPPAPARTPLAPVLYVETTVWACPISDRLVSLSAVSPDRRALERARSVLDAAVCH